MFEFPANNTGVFQRSFWNIELEILCRKTSVKITFMNPSVKLLLMRLERLLVREGLLCRILSWKYEKILEQFCFKEPSEKRCNAKSCQSNNIDLKLALEKLWIRILPWKFSNNFTSAKSTSRYKINDKAAEKMASTSIFANQNLRLLKNRTYCARLIAELFWCLSC